MRRKDQTATAQQGAPMTKHDPNTRTIRDPGHIAGTSELAHSAMSVLSQRQEVTAAGARQYIVDHLMRAICSRRHFDPAGMLEELRGHRLPVDAVIDTYVPTAARQLGYMWKDDTADFATVTIGAMRLQALLSAASAESLDFVRPLDDTVFMLVVVPPGEQHSLGAFVLAAQLRRLGARVDMSFCEEPTDFVSRVICDTPDMILFSASSTATLESIRRLALDCRNVVSRCPLFALGGSLGNPVDVAKDISGIDHVTCCAREVMARAASHTRLSAEQNST